MRVYLDRVAIIEPKNKEILRINISKEQNMFVAAQRKRFSSKVVDYHGKHSVYTVCGTWYIHLKSTDS